MHLGQSAVHLAKVMGRPEPTLMIFARLLRNGGWIRIGGRGRSASHLSAEELSRFVIAIMAAPDSPAIGVDRMPHFYDLPLDDDRTPGMTFGRALAAVLDRLAAESGEEAARKEWHVMMSIPFSTALIVERFADDEDGEPQREEHQFSSMVNADPHEPATACMPYYGGLDISVSLRWFTLFRIAKAVLGNEPDPLPALPALAEMVASALTEGDE